MAFIYFGSEADLGEEGSMSHIKDLAAFDRFHNPHEPINFYVNTEPECKAERQFEPDQPAVALFVHEEVLPFSLQAPDDDLSMANLTRWLNVSILQFSLRWGGRASTVIDKIFYNGIVLVLPDGDVTEKGNFLAEVVGAAAQHIRTNIEGVIAVITEFEDPYLTPDTPQMAKKLGVEKKEDLPGLWVIHGHENKAVRYPYDLANFELSPEMLLLWARRTILEIESPILDNYLKSLEDNETVDIDLIEVYTKRNTQLKEEIELVNKTFNKVQEDVH